MTQGPRGGWVRVVFAGVGAVFCFGVIGCLGTDKPKDMSKLPTNTKQPGPGLPGTPMLPGSQGMGAGNTKFGQQPLNQYQYGPSQTGTSSGLGSGSIQPTSGFGSLPPTGQYNRQPTNAAGTGLGAGGIAPSVAPVGSSYQQGMGSGGSPSPNWGSPTGGAAADPYRRSDTPQVPLTDIYPPAPPGGGAGGIAPAGPIAPPVAPPGRGN